MADPRDAQPTATGQIAAMNPGTNSFPEMGNQKPTTLVLPVPPSPKVYTAPKITPEDIKKFQEDGVIVIRNAIPMEWIEVLRAIVENVLQTSKQGKLAFEYTPAGKPGRFYAEIDVWRRMERVREWIRDGPMGEIAGRLMQAEYAAFLYDQLFVKEPKTEEATPWHQDRPYWAVRGQHVSSLWIPLDVIDKSTCVEYVKGSHKWSQEYSPKKFVPGGRLYAGTNLPPLPDMDEARASGKHEFLSWDMQPGDVLVFNAMTVHGSQGNLRMNTRRRAWAFRFVGDEHEFVDQPGREWGWPVVDLWSEGMKDGDKVAGHRDHEVVWKRGAQKGKL